MNKRHAVRWKGFDSAASPRHLTTLISMTSSVVQDPFKQDRTERRRRRMRAPESCQR